jgi:hypothetical protein
MTTRLSILFDVKDQNVDGRIIINGSLNKSGKIRTEFSYLRMGPSDGYRNEPSGSIYVEEFF